MGYINTVLGRIPAEELGITLPHEHICCYSDYALRMAGEKYLDKGQLLKTAVAYLTEMKKRYGLSSFVDCTAVNIGRDLQLLQEVSRQTGIHIICATGFYYTEESLFERSSPERIAEYIVYDALNTNAGIIKCAVEQPELSAYEEKILRATAKAQKILKLPVVMHTDAPTQNARKAVELLLSLGVSPKAITVSHLSDSQDGSFVKEIAATGCYLGFDRLYNRVTEEYISQKVDSIRSLVDAGFADQILLSHDALFFSGFAAEPAINPEPRFFYCFENILPAFEEALAEKFMKENPRKMLLCGEGGTV